MIELILELIAQFFGEVLLQVLAELVFRGGLRTLQFITLLAVPIAAGLCMSLFARMRVKRGQDLMRLDYFSYAYLFALACTLVRFFLARG